MFVCPMYALCVDGDEIGRYGSEEEADGEEGGDGVEEVVEAVVPPSSSPVAAVGRGRAAVRGGRGRVAGCRGLYTGFKKTKDSCEMKKH